SSQRLSLFKLAFLARGGPKKYLGFRLPGAETLAMKDKRRRRRKPRAVLLPHTNPRRFVVKHRPRLSKLTDYPELDFADYERRLPSLHVVLQLSIHDYLVSSTIAPDVLEICEHSC